MSNSYQVNKIINKKINKIVYILFFCFLIIVVKLYFVNIKSHSFYKKKLEEKTNVVVLGNSVPRGRIYDRNHNLLVDNVAVKAIYYKKLDGITTKEEILLAYQVSKLIDLDYKNITLDMIKDFYLIDQSSKANKKITDKEWDMLNKRKLSSDDIKKLKKERLTKSDLSIYGVNDYKAIYLYYLMNKDYYFSDKVIKNKNVTDYEYALIGEGNYKGFGIKEEWERVYLYGNTLRSILGSISTSTSGVPSDNLKYYLDKGYALNDRVGLTGLEKQYEGILKGEKDKYLVSGSNLKLIESGTKGMDIVLTIDIKLQEKIDKILKEEIKKAKKASNTKYYDHSYIVIQDVKTGEILAISGQKINKDSTFIDITYLINSETVQPGSIVKGASMIVGYNSGVVKIGSKEYDSCIYFKGITKKCSWRNMGYVNDLEAIKYSSNVFQYKTAIKVAGSKYCYNCRLKLSRDAFNIYRSTFYQFGLGSYTGIDLPNEIPGFKGYILDNSLIIDYAIGQFDTYTPIELSQYINTIANDGARVRPHLLKEIYSSTGKKIYEQDSFLLNKVHTGEKYMKRIKTAFRSVMTGGTGVGYINSKYLPAGKTGTSESFIDTDHDGVIDTKTMTKNFIGYMPYNNPEISIMVTSPNIAKAGGYLYNVTQKIVNRSTNAYFNSVK